MKDRWSDTLPVYGLRYPIAWLFVCVLSFTFFTALFSYQAIESWVFRNKSLSPEQQNSVAQFLQPIQGLRLDAPFLRWQEWFRSSNWLWQEYELQEKQHPAKIRYKLGSKPLFYYSEHLPLQVLLVGDSLAKSIELSLSPLLGNIPSVHLTANGIVSSTLTNKHFADWPQILRQLLNQKQYDVVLVFIGANSCQAIRNDDGSIIGYGSKAWPQAYGEKVKDFMLTIRNQGAAVWWLMNPPMQKTKYQVCMDSIGDVQRSIAREAADEIIETGTIVSAVDGSYTQSKVIDGELYSLRAKDGVHFTLAGSRLISEEVLRRIYENYRIRFGRSFDRRGVLPWHGARKFE